MSSSEVQRTLVKSPPELWAELGDPAALARHLGGLGDIRITRIDPEQSVEWESEDASGTVLIKPSGWGTKVTLTVTRKTPVPAVAQGEAATGPEEAATGTEEAATGPEGARAGPVAEADGAGEDESTLEADPIVDDESPPLAEWAAQAESALAAHHAVEASPPAEVDPSPETEPGPAAYAEPVATVAFETDGQPEDGGAPAQHSGPGPELVPRRGFFARLFGRRPRQEAVEPAPAVEPEPSEVPVPAVWQPGALDGTLAEAQAEPLAQVVPAEPQPGPTVTIGPAEVASEPPGAVVAEELHDEPLAAVAQENAADEMDGPRESAGESPDNGSSDSAAVAQTPEEAASAEVTEVLTAVLDRLGAAHHRPFSRG